MKRTMMVCIMLIILMVVGCNQEENTFVVGMEAMYPPFNWTQLDDSNGAVQISGSQEYAAGYDVEIAKRIAEGLGKELVIEKIEWGGLVPALQSNTIDAIIAGMSPTEERKEVIDFTDAYYTSNFVLVVKADGEYANASTLDDFSGAIVTGQMNTSHYRVIDQIPGVQKDPAMEDFTAMRVALESGLIDAYVSERPEGLSAEHANPNLKMIEPNPNFEAPIEDVTVSVGLRKDDAMTAQINQILANITEDARQQLMDQAITQQLAEDK